MDYAAAAGRMDAAWDDRLGDTIFYSVGGAEEVEIKGLVLDPDAQDDFASGSLDELPQRKRVKVSRAVVPSPSRADRLRADLLGPGRWQPTSKKPRVAGRYFIFDVQKVG